MFTTRRILCLPVGLFGLGCVALNPAYDDADSRGGSSGDGSGDGSASSTVGATSGSTEGSEDTSTTTAGPGESVTTDVPPTTVEFIDEAWEGQFGAGAQTADFHWVAGVVPTLQLREGTIIGTFESRIFDSGGEATRWTSVQWGPRAAYGLPLDEASAWQADQYAQGAIGDADLSLLLDFEDGPWASMEPVIDHSSWEFDGFWNGMDDATRQPGIFGWALSNPDGEGGQRIDFPDGRFPGTGAFTWTLWFRASACVGNQTMIALDSPSDAAPGAFGTTFIGCDYLADDPRLEGIDGCTGDSGLRYAYAGIQGAEGSVARTCSTIPIDDDQWHFVALRRRVGNGTQALDIVVDRSEPVSTPEVNGVTDVAIHPGSDAETFTVAGGNTPTYPGLGAYDQVALWNRELHNEELYALYERGAQRLRVQVRACEKPDCADQPFVGPGPNAARDFLDPGPSAEHTVDLSESALAGRYFQYRILMARRQDVGSPATTFVRVIGERE